MNLFEAIAEGAREGRPALRIDGREVGYGALIRLVEETARAFTAREVLPGDRIVLLLPSSIEHVVAVLAAGVAGAIAVPCDPGSGSVRLAQVLAETSPRMCLLAGGAAGLSPTGGGCPAFGFEIDLADCTPHLSRASGDDAPRTGPAPEKSRDAMIRFTSGSTGRPKGVVLEHTQLVATARLVSLLFGLREEHRELLVAPLFHSGGWQRVAGTLVGGGCVVLSREPLSIPGLLDEVESSAVTGFFAPPPLIRLLLTSGRKGARALAGCRTVEIGSAPLGAHELEQLLELVPEARVFVHYGLTECSRAVILDAHAHPGKLHTVGTPAPGVALELRGEDGESVGAGQSGEVFLRGPQLARGYWRRADLDAERFARGWLATGDYGKLDANGFLELLGRRDDRIESAGYSFFPAEVEAELGPVEGVAQYLIAGVPDPRGVLGEVPWAFVVPRQPRDFSPRAFASQARRKLPPYMVPRRVLAVPTLPLTASGKPDRRAALESYASDVNGGG